MSRIWIMYLSAKPSPDLLAGHATLRPPVLRRYAFVRAKFFSYLSFLCLNLKNITLIPRNSMSLCFNFSNVSVCLSHCFKQN